MLQPVTRTVPAAEALAIATALEANPNAVFCRRPGPNGTVTFSITMGAAEGPSGAAHAPADDRAPAADPPARILDLAVFLAEARTRLGAVSDEAAEGMRLMIAEALRQNTGRRQFAYMLATAWWETARTMQPVREAFYLSRDFDRAERWRKRHLDYYPFYGRGYVQLTHEANYRRAGRELGPDFVAEPDLVMRPEYAIPIMFAGMKQGWFTARKLDDYIDEIEEGAAEDLAEYRRARRIINGTDKKNEIAEIAVAFEAALKAAGYRKGAVAVPDIAEATGTFEDHVASLGLAHFRAAEFLVKGASHTDVNSAAYGLNTDPPRALWRNLGPVARALDAFRASVGRPVVISSAYRAPAFNAAIGGAANSRHMAFDALDFTVRGSPVGPADWAAELRAMRAAGLFKGGIGAYSTFVHVDARGENADWLG